MLGVTAFFALTVSLSVSLKGYENVLLWDLIILTLSDIFEFLGEDPLLTAPIVGLFWHIHLRPS